MPDLRLEERLQPSLLDRLRKKTANDRREPPTIMNTQQLREVVLRDLEWLLNTVALDNVQDLENHPHVATSVVNYGLPDLTGCTGIDRAELARRIRQAIIDFEPRLDPRTVRVVAVSDKAGPGKALSFRIEAELWGQPVPLPLLLRTWFDPDSSHVSISEAEEDE